MAKQKIVIVGGGIAGLSLAFYLSRKNSLDITLYEKTPDLGGLARTTTILKDIDIERFYHFVYHNEQKHISDFFKTVGLKPHIKWNQIRTGICFSNSIYPIDTLLQILMLPRLTPLQKIRFILGTAWIIVTPFTPKLDQITANSYLDATIGNNANKLIWRPLLISKFGNQYRKVPASWIKARLKSFSARGKSQLTRFGYITNTYGQLFRSLEAKLKTSAVKIIHHPVDKVSITGKKITSISVSGATRNFDQYFFTLPMSSLAKLITNKNFASKLEKFDDLYALVLLIVSKQPFSKFYWININNSNIPFTGIIEQTNLTGTKRYAGHSNIYLIRYLTAGNPLLAQLSNPNSRRQLTNRWLNHLTSINPSFSGQSIVETHLSLGEGAAPIPFLNYQAHSPDFTLGLNNAHFINSAMIFPADRGTGNTVALVKRLIDQIYHE